MEIEWRDEHFFFWLGIFLRDGSAMENEKEMGSG